jgi:PAS domain S-box-containing protein
VTDFLHSTSLKTRILLLVLTVLMAGIWGLAVRTAAVLQADIAKLLSDQMSATVNYVANDIDRTIQSRIDTLTELALSIPPGIVGNASRVREQLQRDRLSKAEFPTGVYVVDADGRVIAEQRFIEGRVGGLLKDRAFFISARTTGKTAIGSPVIGRFKNEPVMTIAVPLRDAAGNFAGVLGGSLHPSDANLFGGLEAAKIGSTGYFLVVSAKDHLIVSATDKSRVMQPLPARGVNPLLDKRLAEGYEGAGMSTTSLGVEVLTVSRNMKTTGWIIIAGVPIAEAFAPIATLQRQIYTAALLLSLTVALALYFLLKRQLAPAEAAGLHMQRMTRGEEPLAPLPIPRHDEIGRLVGNFNQLLVERIRLEDSLRTEIVERQRAEEALKTNEELMRNTFEHAAVGIAHIAPHTYRIDMANDKFCQLLGYAPRELIGTDSRVLTPADDLPALESERARVIAGEIKTSTSERRLIRKDGALLWINRSLSLVRNTTGQPTYFISVIEDISARKDAAEARARLAAVAESSSDAIFIRDTEGKITFWNDGAQHCYGYTADETIGRPSDFLVPPELLEERKQNWNKLQHGLTVANFETERIRKNGVRINVSVSLSPVKDSAGNVLGIATIARDITEGVRKAALMQLLESLARATNEATTPEVVMQACLERICNYGNWPLGHVAMYAPGKSAEIAPISYWRCADAARFSEFILYSNEFTHRMPHGQFVGVAMRERRAVWVEDLAQESGFGRRQMACKPGIRAGFVFPVIVHDDVAGFLEFFATETRAPDSLLLEAINSVASQLARLIERSRAAANLVHVNAALEARVAGRTAELEAANKQLASFSYTVAHDLRTPLRAINGFSALVLETNQDKLSEASVGHLKRIHAGSVRMGDLIDDLLELTRLSRQEIRRHHINLSELAAAVAASLADAYPDRRVSVTIKPGLHAYADAGLMRIVLENLVGNAWKFTARADAPKIDVGAETRDGKTAFYVRDNGAGFDMQYAHKLFAPFQRLHHAQDFEGTGIGLATVKNIVQRHGGDIWLDSAVQQGTTAFFTIGDAV